MSKSKSSIEETSTDLRFKHIEYSVEVLERFSHTVLIIKRQFSAQKGSPFGIPEVIGNISFPAASTTKQEVEEWQKILSSLKLKLQV
jgi:hypothetical protein